MFIVRDDKNKVKARRLDLACLYLAEYHNKINSDNYRDATDAEKLEIFEKIETILFKNIGLEPPQPRSR